MLSCIRGEERLYVCKSNVKNCAVLNILPPPEAMQKCLYIVTGRTKLPQHDEKQNLPGIICVESVSSFSLCSNYRLSWVFERTTE